MILPFNPLQPMPIRTLVARMDVAGTTVTGVTRLWKEGDCARCRLCPECAAADNVCLVMLNRVVTKGEAALFDLADFHTGEGRRPEMFGRSSLN